MSEAGFTVGQTLLDVGCGPGHASIDLAGIKGPSGRVVAIDRSRRFLDVLADAGRIGLDLPRWLHELGFQTRSLRPIVDVVDASSFVWQWPRAFVEVGLQRLVDLGRLAPR